MSNTEKANDLPDADTPKRSASMSSERFMEKVRQACGTPDNPRRANISKLKRGLRSIASDGGSSGGFTQAFEVAGRGIGRKWPREKVKLAIGVAGLYATHGAPSRTRSRDWASIGSVLRAAPPRGETGYGRELSRIAAATDTKTALHRLNRACSLAGDKASGLLDWPRLLDDLVTLLLSDDHDRKERVEMRWAQDFLGMSSDN